MKQLMTSLLIVAAMAGASCTGNAQNNNGGYASENDTTVVAMEQDAPQTAPEDASATTPTCGHATTLRTPWHFCSIS